MKKSYKIEYSFSREQKKWKRELNVNGRWCESTTQQFKFKPSLLGFFLLHRYWNLNEQFNLKMFAVAKMFKYYFNPPSSHLMKFPLQFYSLTVKNINAFELILSHKDKKWENDKWNEERLLPFCCRRLRSVGGVKIH